MNQPGNDHGHVTRVALSLRLPPEALETAKDLAARYQMSLTDAVELALRLLRQRSEAVDGPVPPRQIATARLSAGAASAEHLQRLCERLQEGA